MSSNDIHSQKYLYLQDREEKTGEVVGGIDKVVVKLELDVETQLGVNFLKSLLKSTVRVVLLDAPLEDLSFLGLPQQWLPALLCFPLFPIGHELGRANLRDPLLVDHSLFHSLYFFVIINNLSGHQESNPKLLITKRACLTLSSE